MGSGLTQSHCPDHCNRGTASSSENGELCKTSGQFIEVFRQVTTKNPAVRQQVAFSGGECRDEAGPEKSTGFLFQQHSGLCGISRNYGFFAVHADCLSLPWKFRLAVSEPRLPYFSQGPQSFPELTQPRRRAILPRQIVPDNPDAARRNLFLVNY